MRGYIQYFYSYFKLHPIFLWVYHFKWKKLINCWLAYQISTLKALKCKNTHQVFTELLIIPQLHPWIIEKKGWMCCYSTFESQRPKATATMPTTMLDSTYTEKWNSSPAVNNECFSKANVEKVVNPPQKPVDSNKVWFWLMKLPLNESPIMIPINRHPIIFTKNVPKKKCW